MRRSHALSCFSHVILCGHTLLISVTSPWGWVAWRLKNEPNTAATAILNNEHPSVPPPLTEAEKFQRTKQQKTLYIYIFHVRTDGWTQVYCVMDNAVNYYIVFCFTPSKKSSVFFA